MNLVNKTSTITVAVVAAIVALAVAAHGSGALRLSPAHAAVHGTEQGIAAPSGSLASGSGNGQGSGSAGGTSSGGPASTAAGRVPVGPELLRGCVHHDRRWLGRPELPD